MRHWSWTKDFSESAAPAILTKGHPAANPFCERLVDGAARAHYFFLLAESCDFR
jgi:hypothetical protein